MRKSHFLPDTTQSIKLGWSNVTLHRQMMRTRLEVLSQCEHLHIVIAQVAHYSFDFVDCFPQAQHQPGFGRNIRVTLPESLQ